MDQEDRESCLRLIDDPEVLKLERKRKMLFNNVSYENLLLLTYAEFLEVFSDRIDP